MSDASSERVSPVKACSTCGEQIPLSAIKCSKCGTFQDWRRHLGFSSTILALLTALLSVATVAGPVLYDLLAEPDSALIGSFQRIEGGRALFLVSNAGSRPGTVERVLLHAVNTPYLHDLLEIKALPLRLTSTDVFVEPGESVFIQAELDSRMKDSFRNQATALTPYCILQLKLANFSGATERTSLTESCRHMYESFFPYELPLDTLLAN